MPRPSGSVVSFETASLLRWVGGVGMFGTCFWRLETQRKSLWNFKEKCVNIKTRESHNSAGMCAVSGSLACKSLSSVSCTPPVLAWPCRYCSFIKLLLMSCEIKPFYRGVSCIYRSAKDQTCASFHILLDWVSMCRGASGQSRWPLSAWRAVKRCLRWQKCHLSPAKSSLDTCTFILLHPVGSSRIMWLTEPNHEHVCVWTNPFSNSRTQDCSQGWKKNIQHERLTQCTLSFPFKFKSTQLFPI